MVNFRPQDGEKSIFSTTSETLLVLQKTSRLRDECQNTILTFEMNNALILLLNLKRSGRSSTMDLKFILENSKIVVDFSSHKP